MCLYTYGHLVLDAEKIRIKVYITMLLKQTKIHYGKQVDASIRYNIILKVRLSLFSSFFYQKELVSTS